MKKDIYILVITLLAIILSLFFIPILYVGISSGDELSSSSKGFVEILQTSKDSPLSFWTKVSYITAENWPLRLGIGLLCLAVIFFAIYHPIGQKVKIYCLLTIIGVSIIWAYINIFGLILLIIVL